METVQAEKGWKAVSLIPEDQEDLVDEYLPASGFGVSMEEVLVWTDVCWTYESSDPIYGLTYPPEYGEKYTRGDLDFAPETALGFLGYLPPGASLSFMDKRAKVASRDWRMFDIARRKEE